MRIETTENQRERLKLGDWSVLSEILVKERKRLRDECESRREDVRHFQGQAYYCKQLCELLEVKE